MYMFQVVYFGQDSIVSLTECRLCDLLSGIAYRLHSQSGTSIGTQDMVGDIRGLRSNSHKQHDMD